jgi:hypothetical protein
MGVCVVNLRALFGKQYHISHDESYDAERSEFRTAEEPWLQIIPCKYGHIFPWGGDLLAVSTNRRGAITDRIRSLPFVEVVQDGSDGINATFPLDRFDEVAEIVRPKRRRRLSESQRQASIDRLRPYWYESADNGGSEALETHASG